MVYNKDFANIESLPEPNLDTLPSYNGYLFFDPDETSFNITAEAESLSETEKLVDKFLKSFTKKNIDNSYIIQYYWLIKYDYSRRQGGLYVPTLEGKKLLIQLFDKIKSYREMIYSMNDHGPYPSFEFFRLRCYMRNVFEMYDKYCSCVRTLIMQEESSQPLKHTLPTTKAQLNINQEKLGNFFNAKFKGAGKNIDYFDTLINDLAVLDKPKDYAMVAHMIFHSDFFVMPKKLSFAGWLRKFFEIIGIECPKDTRMSKYVPSQKVKSYFRYLAGF